MKHCKACSPNRMNLPQYNDAQPKHQLETARALSQADPSLCPFLSFSLREVSPPECKESCSPKVALDMARCFQLPHFFTIFYLISLHHTLPTSSPPMLLPRCSFSRRCICRLPVVLLCIQFASHLSAPYQSISHHDVSTLHPLQLAYPAMDLKHISQTAFMIIHACYWYRVNSQHASQSHSHRADWFDSLLST